MKIRRESHNLVKIGQKYRALDMKIQEFFFADNIKSPYQRSLQLKWYQAVGRAEEI